MSIIAAGMVWLRPGPVLLCARRDTILDEKNNIWNEFIRVKCITFRYFLNGNVLKVLFFTDHVCGQGRQTGGVGGVSTPPEFRMGGGVENLSTPPDFEKIFLGGGGGGVGSP